MYLNASLTKYEKYCITMLSLISVSILFYLGSGNVLGKCVVTSISEKFQTISNGTIESNSLLSSDCGHAANQGPRGEVFGVGGPDHARWRHSGILNHDTEDFQNSKSVYGAHNVISNLIIDHN